MRHVIIFLLLLSAAVTTTPSSTLHLRELETMMETLRPLGYTLFCNAISTSDIQFEIISSKAPSDLYTIFAAKDPYLYALDMASDAAAYVSTLRYHVSPNRRLMISELRNLESPFLETMLPHYSILVSVRVEDDRVLGRRNGSVVRVDGVRISDPDLFVGSRIVVHGLNGILVTGIVRNDDLVDEESGLGLRSSPSPVVEDGVSVAAPPSSPLPPPVVAPLGIESFPPSVVVVEAPPSPVVIRAPPNVVVQTHPTPVVVPDVSDDGKGLNERRRGPKHHSLQEKGGDAGKKSKEERQGEKHKPAHEKGSKEASNGGKGSQENETDGGKGLKEGKRGVKHHSSQENAADGGKGSKEEANRVKHHRVIHQNPYHPVTHNNRRRQTKRNRVHQKDDL